MDAHEFRRRAQDFLQEINRDPAMPHMTARILFTQVLALMIGVHNESVEPEARLQTIRLPQVEDQQIDMLRQAFEGDILPLIDWLSPLVDWDPTWIYSLLLHADLSGERRGEDGFMTERLIREVRYLSDDRDSRHRNELVFQFGGNGDWYVATVPEGQGTIGKGVRLSTSGGASFAAPGLTTGIAKAFQALAKAHGPGITHKT